MKKFKLKGWHFWLAYLALMAGLLLLLNSCATTAPADMRYSKGLMAEKRASIIVTHCNRE